MIHTFFNEYKHDYSGHDQAFMEIDLIISK